MASNHVNDDICFLPTLLANMQKAPQESKFLPQLSYFAHKSIQSLSNPTLSESQSRVSIFLPSFNNQQPKGTATNLKKFHNFKLTANSEHMQSYTDSTRTIQQLGHRCMKILYQILLPVQRIERGIKKKGEKLPTTGETQDSRASDCSLSLSLCMCVCVYLGPLMEKLRGLGY